MGKPYEEVIERDFNLEKQPKSAFHIKKRVLIYMACTAVVFRGILYYVMREFSWMSLFSFAIGVSLGVLLIVVINEYVKRSK